VGLSDQPVENGGNRQSVAFGCRKRVGDADRCGSEDVDQFPGRIGETFTLSTAVEYAFSGTPNVVFAPPSDALERLVRRAAALQQDDEKVDELDQRCGRVVASA
jgi:hypothetical protein